MKSPILSLIDQNLTDFCFRGNAPGRLSFSSRFRPTPPPTTTTTTIRTTTTTEPLAARPQDGGLPPPIKAAPGKQELEQKF